MVNHSTSIPFLKYSIRAFLLPEISKQTYQNHTHLRAENCINGSKSSMANLSINQTTQESLRLSTSHTLTQVPEPVYENSIKVKKIRLKRVIVSISLLAKFKFQSLNDPLAKRIGHFYTGFYRTFKHYLEHLRHFGDCENLNENL